MAGSADKSLLSFNGRFHTLFKGFILFGICIIGAVFVYYTNIIIDDIRESEERIARTYTSIWQLMASESVSGPVTSVLFDEVILKSNFPIIVSDTLENPLFWKAVPGIPPASDDPRVLEEIRRKMLSMKARKGEIPIYVDSVLINKLFYDDPPVVGKLRWIPIVEMALVVAFIILALVGFQHIRLSEQRSIWVGMAKETAHQLGTPISSLMGWISLLKSGETTYTPRDIYYRIDSDLKRLESIANRFGKIGSLPVRELSQINDLTAEVVQYFRDRLPHSGKGVQIHFIPGMLPEVMVNPDLYRWVIENLIKNALEAVDSKTGEIYVKSWTIPGEKKIVIEVTDNGRGIPRRDMRKIFRPGFTTRKRGWGLGLSLARRIVREYHGGSISLTKTEPGRGSTFTIRLPVS